MRIVNMGKPVNFAKIQQHCRAARAKLPLATPGATGGIGEVDVPGLYCTAAHALMLLTCAMFLPTDRVDAFESFIDGPQLFGSLRVVVAAEGVKEAHVEIDWLIAFHVFNLSSLRPLS